MVVEDGGGGWWRRMMTGRMVGEIERREKEWRVCSRG